MPTLFEISIAALAIGMATNANAPNSTPVAPQKTEVIVQTVNADDVAPVTKPDTDIAEAATQPADAR